MSSCHGSAQEKDFTGDSRILLMGNPNVGKSVIFHHLTGKYALIWEIPVDITSAQLKLEGYCPKCKEKRG